MKKILVISPVHRDVREIAALQEKEYSVSFHSFKNETFYKLWFGTDARFFVHFRHSKINQGHFARDRAFAL